MKWKEVMNHETASMKAFEVLYMREHLNKLLKVVRFWVANGYIREKLARQDGEITCYRA